MKGANIFTIFFLRLQQHLGKCIKEESFPNGFPETNCYNLSFLLFEIVARASIFLDVTFMNGAAGNCIWDKNRAGYTALWVCFQLVHSSQSSESVSIWSLLLVFDQLKVALKVQFMKQLITIFSPIILFLGTTTPAWLSALKRERFNVGQSLGLKHLVSQLF